MDKPNVIRDKSYSFALKIIKLYQSLASRHEYVLSKQVLRSGTGIGANVEEALAAQSRPDFHTKLTIAYKEARETNYWLRLLSDSQIMSIDYSSHLKDSEEIIRILNAITRKTKSARKSSVGLNS